MKNREKDLPIEDNLQLIALVIFIVIVGLFIGLHIKQSNNKDKDIPAETCSYHGAMYDEYLDIVVIK